jgi:hypothetical protein
MNRYAGKAMLKGKIQNIGNPKIGRKNITGHLRPAVQFKPDRPFIGPAFFDPILLRAWKAHRFFY